jgi:transposase-like protein
MARERRLYSEEFEREAVKLVGQPGASKTAIARELSIGANLLGCWYRDANVDGLSCFPEAIPAKSSYSAGRSLVASEC